MQLKEWTTEPPPALFNLVLFTVNSRLADTPLLQIPIDRGLTENDPWYYGLSLFQTQNDVLKVPAIMRVDCTLFLFVCS